MKTKNLFWGLFFIGAAALIVLNQLGYLIGINLFSLICVILLVPIIIKSAMYMNFGGILFPMALLGIVFAEPLGITNLTPWPILAVALFGTIGFSLVFHKSKYNWSHCGNFENKGECFSEVINGQDENDIDFNVSFGSSIKYVNTDNFKKGNFKCSFGELKVYFDNAKISEDGAIINLDISFGGVELYIPKTWNISTGSLTCNLGGIEEKNYGGKGDGPKVQIRGNVSFSGVEIVYI